MRCLLLATLLFVGPASAADRWAWSERVAVSSAPQAGVFHHLEGAGRKHIALNAGYVGVAWEDNRSADPQVYLAVKSPASPGFGPAMRVSQGSEAYEPAISAHGSGFVVVYEQDATVLARQWTPSGLSAASQLSAQDIDAASHPSIAAAGNQLIAVWRERAARRYRLRASVLNAQSGQVVAGAPISVESAWLDTPVLMPTLALHRDGVCVAWEDRRAGHTRLLTAYSDWPDLEFSKPVNLNEFYSNRNAYDKGNGATRVAIAAFADDEVVAAWMDKRRGGSGYGIFAALGFDAGASFGPNEKVHSAEGDKLPHYNPAVAGNPDGDFVIAWDDYRRGNLDIWLSAYTEDGEWSIDFAPPPAAGEGEQSHPSLALDADGTLHLLWVERADPLAPSRLWYSRGELAEAQ